MSKWAIELSGLDIKYEPITVIKSQALVDFVADFSLDLELQAAQEVKQIAQITHLGTWTLYVDGSSYFRDEVVPPGDLTFYLDDKVDGPRLCSLSSDWRILVARLKLGECAETEPEVSIAASDQVRGNVESPQMSGSLMAPSSTAVVSGRWKAQTVDENKDKVYNCEVPDAADTLNCAGHNNNGFAVSLFNVASFGAGGVSEPVQVDASSRLDPQGSISIGHVLPSPNEASKFLFRRVDLSPLPLLSSIQDLTMTACAAVVVAVTDQEILAESNPCLSLLALAEKYSLLQITEIAANSLLNRCPFLTIAPHTRTPCNQSLSSRTLKPRHRRYERILKDFHDGECGAHLGGRTLANRIITYGYYWPTLRNDAHRFGVPSEIICDNGSQFISAPTRHFCDKWNITLVTSTPRYPQANGQAESSNKVINSSLKKKLKEKKSKWAEELPRILWANRTTPRTATVLTPFSLVYGCEAVLPAEVTTPTARYGLLTPKRNNEELSYDLDTIEERRDLAYIRMATYQQMVARSFNKNVKARIFKEGDWVLRKLFQNTRELNAGKLEATWEGPYQIDRVVGKGAYRLATPEGKLVSRSWNAAHLKPYHF
uniref:Integrase catalytic domain-containing protein n=1 Tax=Chenopodium quinoa TaxID=63459 RepID=A0A803MIB6_CHEQI